LTCQHDVSKTMIYKSSVFNLRLEGTRQCTCIGCPRHESVSQPFRTDFISVGSRGSHRNTFEWSLVAGVVLIIRFETHQFAEANGRKTSIIYGSAYTARSLCAH
jgi:hypothetical protein